MSDGNGINSHVEAPHLDVYCCLYIVLFGGLTEWRCVRLCAKKKTTNFHI